MKPNNAKTGIRIAVAIGAAVLFAILYGRHVNSFPKVGEEWTGGQRVTVSRPFSGYVQLEGTGGQIVAQTIEQRLEARAREHGDWYGMLIGVGVSVFPAEGR